MRRRTGVSKHVLRIGVGGDAVAEVKLRLDIVEVVGGYVALQRSGRDHKALCPFHGERTASFHVSQERQAWYCFGCQEGGDVFSFVMRMERVEFRQALEQLAERAGVELERGGGDGSSARRRRLTLDLNTRAQAWFEHVLWSTAAGEPGRRLLADRSVSEDWARRFGIGFAPMGGSDGDALIRYLTNRRVATVSDVVEAGLGHARGGGGRDRFRNRLIFPIRDERGAVVGFGGRALGDEAPKYLNSPETAVYRKSSVLYGLDLARHAISAAGTVLVVEGYFDVVAAHVGGAAYAVASSGTALSREQVRLLGRHANLVTLCLDADAAGRAATSRAVDVLAAEGLSARICILPVGIKDPDELIRRDPGCLTGLVESARPEWQVLLDDAVGNDEGGSVEARRGAAERVIGVLARIPEASTRNLYVQQAARRLELATAALGADVERVHRDPGRSGRRIKVTAPAISVGPATSPGPGPAPAPATFDESVGANEREAPKAWETYIAAVLIRQPALAPRLVGELGLDAGLLRHASARRLVEVALALPPGTAFPMHRLGTAEQSLAARLLMQSIPELDDGADPAHLERAIADCLRLLRENDALERYIEVRRAWRRAQDDGRDDAADELLDQLNVLRSQLGRLGRSSTLTAS